MFEKIQIPFERAKVKVGRSNSLSYKYILYKFMELLNLDEYKHHFTLLKNREVQQKIFDRGGFPEFPKETTIIREGKWTAGEIPKDLQDRRVEITGPADRKMIINALNSGAKTFMADLEDSNSPTWDNSIQGQQNLLDTNKKTIS